MFESFEIVGFDEILSENFPHLMNLRWVTCSRNRKKKSNGEFVIGEVKALNPFMKFLSIDNEAIEGYDAAIVIDNNVFVNLSVEDKEEFVKLLLKTVDYDDKIKIKKFSLLSFHEITEQEVELYERVQLIADQVYAKDE
jgi:hypothetical protein